MSRPKSKYGSRRSRKAGLPPGSLVYLGRAREVGKSRITVIEYSENFFNVREVGTPSELFPLKPAPVVTWINVDGVHNESILEEFGQLFNLQPLLLEDILNTEQRPKCESSDDFLYIILKMFDFDTQKQDVITEQVSLVIGHRLLLTFQEDEGDEFNTIRERLRLDSKRLRKNSADYLAYSLLDIVIDRYFILLEKLGTHLESIEEHLLVDNSPNVLQNVHQIKRELIFLRKNIWPVREVITTLQHIDTELMSEQTQVHLRDIYDHTIQVMDTLETYRDLLSGIQDLYLSILSNRMNEIMKVLTIISTVFIPLTFIVGVYGMNFEYMPELKRPEAYPIIWLLMIAIALGMLVYFKRKRWI